MSGPKLWDKCAVYDVFFVYDVPESLGYTSGSFMPSSVYAVRMDLEKGIKRDFIMTLKNTKGKLFSLHVVSYTRRVGVLW